MLFGFDLLLRRESDWSWVGRVAQISTYAGAHNGEKGEGMNGGNFIHC